MVVVVAHGKVEGNGPVSVGALIAPVRTRLGEPTVVYTPTTLTKLPAPVGPTDGDLRRCRVHVSFVVVMTCST